MKIEEICGVLKGCGNPDKHCTPTGKDKAILGRLKNESQNLL